MIKNKEVRFLNIETRNEDEKESMVIEGYAIVFNQETLIGDAEYGFIEIIDKSALNCANVKDVPLKYTHTDNRLI